MFYKGFHFYHGITRKIVSVMGTLFNEIPIVYLNEYGQIQKKIIVPIVYGKGDSYIRQLSEHVDETSKLKDKHITTLPFISYEMTSISYRPQAKKNELTKYSKSINNSTKGILSFEPSPYDYTFSVHLYAKTENEIWQIVEQITPFFQPSRSVKIKHPRGLDLTHDLQISLQSISIGQDTALDLSDLRLVEYILDFQVRTEHWGPTGSDYETAVQEFATTNGPRHPSGTTINDTSNLPSGSQINYGLNNNSPDYPYNPNDLDSPLNPNNQNYDPRNDPNHESYNPSDKDSFYYDSILDPTSPDYNSSKDPTSPDYDWSESNWGGPRDEEILINDTLPSSPAIRPIIRKTIMNYWIDNIDNHDSDIDRIMSIETTALPITSNDHSDVSEYIEDVKC